MKRTFLSIALVIALLTVASCKKDSSVTCPAHYSGTNCSDQTTPSEIQTTQIIIQNFPSTKPNGSDWNTTESTGHADVYLVISDASGNILLNTRSNYIQNASNQNAYTITTTPIIFSEPSSAYTFTLYNRNNISADDVMGVISQSIYSGTGGFPAIINLNNTSGTSIQVSAQYYW